MYCLVFRNAGFSALANMTVLIIYMSELDKQCNPNNGPCVVTSFCGMYLLVGVHPKKTVLKTFLGEVWQQQQTMLVDVIHSI